MKNYKITLIGLSLILNFQTALAQEFSTLVLGTPTPAESAVSKATVLLRLNGANCSGVAITPSHVLTAGHCVEHQPPASKIKVYLGSNKVLLGEVSGYTLHPRFGKEGRYLSGDLAIVKMARPFSSAVVPAPIFTGTIPRGTQLLAAGFGWSNRSQTRTRELYQTIYVWGREASAIPRVFSDGTGLMQYLTPQSLCKGDSGGPTFINTSEGLRTVGIHSMANCNDTAVDVTVSDHRTWIRQTAQ